MKVINHWIFKDSEGHYQDLYQTANGTFLCTIYSRGADGILKETRIIDNQQAENILSALKDQKDYKHEWRDNFSQKVGLVHLPVQVCLHCNSARMQHLDGRYEYRLYDTNELSDTEPDCIHQSIKKAQNI